MADPSSVEFDDVVCDRHNICRMKIDNCDSTYLLLELQKLQIKKYHLQLHISTISCMFH